MYDVIIKRELNVKARCCDVTCPILCGDHLPVSRRGAHLLFVYVIREGQSMEVFRP